MSLEIIRRSTVAILHKDGIYAAIATAITDHHNFVSNYDPRAANHFYSRSFETPAIAETEFSPASVTGVKNSVLKSSYA